MTRLTSGYEAGTTRWMAKEVVKIVAPATVRFHDTSMWLRSPRGRVVKSPPDSRWKRTLGALAGKGDALSEPQSWSFVSGWPLHLEVARWAKDDGVHLTCEVDTYALQGHEAPAPWR